MLPASVNSAAGTAPIPGTEYKPNIPEQHFDTVEENQQAPVPAETEASPASPASSGAPISVEAVTALQQVDDTQAADERRAVAATAVEDQQAGALNINVEEASTEAAQGVQENAQLREAQARYEARSEEVPVGEETDSAGRSQRNPLDLQI